MATIRFNGVTKRFGAVTAVDDLDLEIKDGEMVSLLGPSGCGKTTTLRMMAGLETISAGEITVDGQRINELPPQERNIGIVFQDYAIFQTMSVERNVAYGLEVKRVERRERERRVQEALDLVGLGAFGKRMPSQLSGGQQQRVALARALVIRPKVLLLDEPLSNLDAALRLNLRKEIRKIQQEVGITAIFVTHDQEEAMSISDRIAVMNTAKMVQYGTPQQIYEQPRSAFVASFIGRTNLLKGVAAPAGSDVLITADGIQFVAHQGAAEPRGAVWLSVRPQDLRLVGEGSLPSANVLRGRLEYLEYLGALVRGEIVLASGQSFLFEVANPRHADVPSVGEEVELTVDPEALTWGAMSAEDEEVFGKEAAVAV